MTYAIAISTYLVIGSLITRQVLKHIDTDDDLEAGGLAFVLTIAWPVVLIWIAGTVMLVVIGKLINK